MLRVAACCCVLLRVAATQCECCAWRFVILKILNSTLLLFMSGAAVEVS